MTVLEQMKASKAAAPKLALADSKLKNGALTAMADCLISRMGDILAANKEDMDAACGSMSEVKLDRLLLTKERIEGMAQGIREVIELPDPAGEELARVDRPNGLVIKKIAAPLGVVAIIYESRPNVTSDAAALCIKSGNACILRSGKEAWRSAHAIVLAMQEDLGKVGLPGELVTLVEDTSRQSASELMNGVGYIDLLIPRGGAGLIRSCKENAKVPCIQTGTGICHIYVDETADLTKAVKIIENAKTSRPSVCNAEEVCVVNRAIAPKFLPMLKEALVTKREINGDVPVELRCDDEAFEIIGGTKAGENDFDTEFLDYILAVKVVGNVEEAICHISEHSTGHSDGILTGSDDAAELFTKCIDSSAVYVNASTRFTDGGEFGLGCEMGISTQKLHARGPMGLRELMTYKYVIRGDGQTR